VGGGGGNVASVLTFAIMCSQTIGAQVSSNDDLKSILLYVIRDPIVAQQ
jgi:hypothetical protein